MKNKILEQLRHASAQRARERLVTKLTEALLFQTRIYSQGIALICWMTDKPARTHREALQFWVIEQLQSVDLQLGHQLIHPLRRQLRDLFASIQEVE